MFWQILIFIVALVVILKGAQLLVDGASSIAYKLKVAPIVIGLTIVAFGTSAPELVASIGGVLNNATGLAFGNVVGSNIFNILIILGISAVVNPLKLHQNTIWKEIPMSFLGAVMLVVLGLQTIIDSGSITQSLFQGNSRVGEITFSNGLTLLAFFIIFIYYTFGIAKASASDQIEIKPLSVPISIIYIVAGLTFLALGSSFFVGSAVAIAKFLGVSDTLIGLTIVAAGTSMPELVTSVVAAYKKQSDIAVGNIVGSNIFNIFFILGITSLVGTIPVVGSNLFDILVLFIATFILFLSAFIFKKRQIGRIEGAFMFALYIVYLGYIIWRG